MTDSPSPRVIPEHRRSLIQEILSQRELVSTAELALMLGTSDVTVRRDLERLERDGILTRTRGGAKLSTRPLEVEERFASREQRNAPAKRVIGDLAAALIRDGEAVGFNDGSTIMRVAKALVEGDREVFVVTNALNVAIVLLEGRHVEVAVVGGILRPTSFGTIWPTDEFTKPFRFDSVVLGADSLDAEAGVAMHHPFDVAVAERMRSRAGRVIVVADSSKWSQRASAVLAGWDEIDVLVSDACDDRRRRRLEEQGVAVVVPD